MPCARPLLDVSCVACSGSIYKMLRPICHVAIACLLLLTSCDNPFAETRELVRPNKDKEELRAVFKSWFHFDPPDDMDLIHLMRNAHSNYWMQAKVPNLSAGAIVARIRKQGSWLPPDTPSPRVIPKSVGSWWPKQMATMTVYQVDYNPALKNATGFRLLFDEENDMLYGHSFTD